MKDKIIKYFGAENLKQDETIEFSWFIFKVIEKNNSIDLQTLDFKSMGSFNQDFELIENLHRSQAKTLANENVEADPCNLRQYAIVSKSYNPESNAYFISRDTKQDGNNSGWYLGMLNETLDINNPENLKIVSLYELSIQNKKLIPYWLLPVGYQVVFTDNVTIQTR